MTLSQRTQAACMILITVIFLLAVWRLDDRTSHLFPRDRAGANNSARADK